jgi:hypothetical protein
MNIRPCRSACAAVLLIVVSCLRAQSPATLAVAGHANANPSLATRDGIVAVAWSAATASSMDVYAAISHDGGSAFGAPVRVNATPGDARVNSELPPRIALLPGKSKTQPDVVVVWTTKGASGTRLIYARSTDGGRTFGAAKDVPGSTGAGARGWESVSVDARGHVDVLWLDHRETVAGGTMNHSMSHEMNHDRGVEESGAIKATPDAPKADPTERAALSKLYFTSLDRASATPITGSVCYCCKTSLVSSGQDVYAAWRHVYAGSQRDIAFTASHDGGKTFAAPLRVSNDGWHIDGCPENGPALAVDAAHRVHVVWVTPPDGNSNTPLGAFYTTSADGKRFAPRTQLPTRGGASHVQIALESDDSPIIAWDEIVEGVRHISVVKRTMTGNRAEYARLRGIPDDPDQGWPVLAANGKDVVVAWVQGSGASSVLRVARTH